MAYLTCNCGSSEFVSWVKLKQTQVGGVVPEVGGYLCASPACLKKADIGLLLKTLELRRLEVEVTQKNEELENAKAAEAARAKGKAPEERQLRDLPPRTDRLGG